MHKQMILSLIAGAALVGASLASIPAAVGTAPVPQNPAAKSPQQPSNAPADPLPHWTNTVGITLVRIPHGSFMMGSPADETGRQNDESQHKVTITHDFCIGTTDVTEAQYLRVVGKLPEGIVPGDDYPIQRVSYSEAVAFCDKLSAMLHRKYRLPTEAEWEYACRAGTSSAYYAGDKPSDLEKIAWFKDNSGDNVHQTSDKKPNAWGLYDMLGNVDQWCSDWYAPYPTGDVVDPTGPAEKTANNQKITRGGSWREDANACRCATRRPTYQNPSYGKYNMFGFRVVMEINGG